MKRILGRKQSVKNEEWIRTADDIENLVSRKELDEKTAITLDEISKAVKDKSVAYAWSGGKDSLVLGKICEMAGIKKCMMAVCNLEYPEFMKWIKENKPVALEILNTGQDLEWLSKHQDMLFPQESATAAKWFSIVQHRAQAKYFKENGLDMIILGRRRADGNYCGKGSNVYTNGKGVTRYSPLSAWSHEEILAFIHYHNIKMPPIYDWHNGYLCGTHPWPARQWTGSVGNGWREVYEIDKDIVIKAAEYIKSAAYFIDSL